MITKPIATACAIGAMIATSFSPAPVSQQPDPQMAAMKVQLDSLVEQVTTLETYMKAQATAGKALGAALTRAEAEGFTAGINPSSREALLGGLWAQVKASESAGTAEADDAPKPKGNQRGKRRER